MAVSNINAFYARLLIDYLVQQGVRKICLSPGSRSTALVVAVAEHPDLETVIIIDERASGFYAVGYARACGEPVAVLCTSGTAAGNFFPGQSGRLCPARGYTACLDDTIFRGHYRSGGIFRRMASDKKIGGNRDGHKQRQTKIS